MNIILTALIFIIIVLSLVSYEYYKENKNLKLNKKDYLQESIPVIGSKKITEMDLYEYKMYDMPEVNEYKPPRGNSGVKTLNNFNV